MIQLGGILKTAVSLFTSEPQCVLECFYFSSVKRELDPEMGNRLGGSDRQGSRTWLVNNPCTPSSMRL